MQVTAITSTFTGSQRQAMNNPYGERGTEQQAFTDFLAGAERPALPAVDEAMIEQAVERTMARMEVLLGAQVAETVVNDDGSVNLARLAQVMSAAETPYANSSQPSFGNAPQMLNLIA